MNGPEVNFSTVTTVFTAYDLQRDPLGGVVQCQIGGAGIRMPACQQVITQFQYKSAVTGAHECFRGGGRLVLLVVGLAAICVRLAATAGARGDHRRLTLRNSSLQLIGKRFSSGASLGSLG